MSLLRREQRTLLLEAAVGGPDGLVYITMALVVEPAFSQR